MEVMMELPYRECRDMGSLYDLLDGMAMKLVEYDLRMEGMTEEMRKLEKRVEELESYTKKPGL